MFLFRRPFWESLIRSWLSSELPFRASALSFTTILSIVPLLALSLSTFQYVGGLERVLELIEALIAEYLVFGTHTFLMTKIQDVVSRLNAQSVGLFGLFFAGLTSSKLFLQFDRSVQCVWSVESAPKSWPRLLFFFGTLVLAPLLFAVMMGVVSSLALDSYKALAIVWSSSQKLRYLLFFLPVLLMFKWAPPVKVMWASALSSSVLTVGLLILAKQAYVWATLNLFNYNQLYGSLAALPLFLMWIYILWSILLIGFLFCAKDQEQRSKRRQLVAQESAEELPN